MGRFVLFLTTVKILSIFISLERGVRWKPGETEGGGLGEHYSWVGGRSWGMKLPGSLWMVFMTDTITQVVKERKRVIFLHEKIYCSHVNWRANLSQSALFSMTVIICQSEKCMYSENSNFIWTPLCNLCSWSYRKTKFFLTNPLQMGILFLS